jgi:2-polyprenyl-3-methyl-5-hydroxy-6-metoxy-1,4-benzoquinol methylase
VSREKDISRASSRVGELVRRLPEPVAAALDPVKHRRAILSYRTGALRTDYPATESELRSSRLAHADWYYSVELLPGFVAQGQYPPDLPMLPRIMLRRCDVAGKACLDVGTMEGLIPVLMRKRGASEVMAVDHSHHSVGKLAAVQHYHGVDFDYRSVGLMYGLRDRLGGKGYDLVNLSGILYHVFSPLSLIAAVRPLLKRGGLMILSTNVTLEDGYVMDFNAAGRLQSEANTFWYPSIGLFDYLLRYMRLQPIDCSFLSHSDVSTLDPVDKPTGYASVVCRAVDRADGDPWMLDSALTSWEYSGLSDWKLADSQPSSSIEYDSPHDGATIDLAEAVQGATVAVPAAERDSHILKLSATS